MHRMYSEAGTTPICIVSTLQSSAETECFNQDEELSNYSSLSVCPDKGCSDDSVYGDASSYDDVHNYDSSLSIRTHAQLIAMVLEPSPLLLLSSSQRQVADYLSEWLLFQTSVA